MWGIYCIHLHSPLHLEFAFEYMYDSKNSQQFGILQWYQDLHYSYQNFCFYILFSKTVSKNFI